MQAPPAVGGAHDDLGPLPDDITVHLDSGYDSGKTRDLLAERDLHGQIAHKGEKAPIHASQRWQIERTNNHHGFIRMEFKRFLNTVIRIAAMIIVRARAIVVRLVAYTVNLDRFFSAWATTERTRFGYG